jgi:hypothetical protein
MRRLLLLALLTLGLPLLALVDVSSAQEARGRNIDAASIARMHARHGHSQYRSGEGTSGHTWQAYRREARQLRRYLRAAQENQRRDALIARWQPVADCEAGGNWHINTGNGHYGGLQFSMRTWNAYGGSGMPNEQPAWRQAEVGERVRADAGLGAWPHCGARYAG